MLNLKLYGILLLIVKASLAHEAGGGLKDKSPAFAKIPKPRV